MIVIFNYQKPPTQITFELTSNIGEKMKLMVHFSLQIFIGNTIASIFWISKLLVELFLEFV
jgi:hypothetical protein